MLVLASLLCIPILFFSSLTVAKTIQDIKAAYLYNFIKFINWPDSESRDVFNLCILGEDPINEKLHLLNNRPVRQAKLYVKKIPQINANEHCQVLFIGESEKKFINTIVNNNQEGAVLTVSSVEDFVVQGGIIGFITLGNIIRFDINLKQARQTHLSISSKLLELANRVEK